MNSSLLSVVTATDIAISLAISRKNQTNILKKEKTNQWTRVQKAGTAKQVKGKGGNARNGVIPIDKKSLKYHIEGNAIASSNPFVVLSPSDDQNSPILEEGEVQQFEVHKEDGEVNRGP